MMFYSRNKIISKKEAIVISISVICLFFFTELLIMFVLKDLDVKTGILENFIDAILLIIIDIPILYIYFFRYIKDHLNMTKNNIDFLYGVLEHSQMSTIVTDKDKKIVFANKDVEKITGYTQKDMLGATPRLFSSGKHNKLFYIKMWECVVEQGYWKGEIWNKKKDGTLYPESLYIKAIYNDENEISNYIGIFNNIEAEQYFKNKTFKAEKMTSLGIMAGGVAHNINNQLSSIAGSAYLLHKSSSKINRNRYFDMVTKSIEESKKLINNMLMYAKGSMESKTTLNINDVILECVDICSSLTQKDIIFKMEKSPVPTAVFIEAAGIKQVFINIINNAVYAIQNNGGENKREISIKIENSKDEEVLIKIQDSGGGISDNDLKNIFDPFYSSKPVHEGTGLGLCSALTTIKAHDGEILVDSVFGVGSTFIIKLPIEMSMNNIDNLKLIHDKKDVFLTNNPKILVVDDNKIIRNVITDILEDVGATVYSAVDGEDGISVFAKHSPFNLIITDITMPKMEGVEMVKKIRKISPNIAVLFITGFTYSEKELEKIVKKDDKNTMMIEKPFDTYAFLNTIEKLLNNNNKGIQ